MSTKFLLTRFARTPPLFIMTKVLMCIANRTVLSIVYDQLLSIQCMQEMLEMQVSLEHAEKF